MTDGDHGVKSIAGAVYGLVAVGGAALVLGLAMFVAPQPAKALPSYAKQTGLSCGRCHVNAAGGGPRTAFGKAFAANGHKVPASTKSSTVSVQAEPVTTSNYGGPFSPPPAWPKHCNGWCLWPD
jgi:hypothetical protein